MPGSVFTIGHSTREAARLVDLLRRNGVDLLVDVRRYPGSRRHPQFNRETLSATLEAAGVRYRHAPDLGGRRSSPLRDDESSPNDGWRNASFRAYADHMGTDRFRAALDRLIADARESTPAILCAEAVPWRCHRNLVSDALTARGVEVRHILSDAEPAAHELNPMARVLDGGRVIYPADPAEQRELF